METLSTTTLIMSATTLTPNNQSDRATRHHQQTQLEQELQAFFQQAGVKTVNLDEIDEILKELEQLV